MGKFEVLVTVTVTHSAWRTVEAIDADAARAQVEADVENGWESKTWQNDDGQTSDWDAEWQTAEGLSVAGDDVRPVESAWTVYGLANSIAGGERWATVVVDAVTAQDARDAADVELAARGYEWHGKPATVAGKLPPAMTVRA